MSQNKYVRSVSFNRTKIEDIARLQLIGKKSFSRYIKKLLDEEIKRQGKELPINQSHSATPSIQKPVVAVNRKPNIYDVLEEKRSYQQTQKPMINPMIARSGIDDNRNGHSR